MFYNWGYELPDDMENLKQLKKEDLKEMGITKRGKISTNSLSHCNVGIGYTL